MSIPYIAIEGPIGVGKSTLAKAISSECHYHLLKEIVSENPFLNQFYQNMDSVAFQTEMFFLCNRYKQIQEIETKYLNNHIPVVSDYHMIKNLIFANRTLSRAEYTKYDQIFHILNKDLPQPNIVIYLHANLDTLLERIKKRGRDFEKHITREYLINLSNDYNQYFQQFAANNPGIPFLSIDCDKYDFVKNKDDLQFILDQLKMHLKGVQINESTRKV